MSCNKKNVIQKQNLPNSTKTLQLIKFLAVKFKPDRVFKKFNEDCLYPTKPEHLNCRKILEYSHLSYAVLFFVS